MPVASQAVAWTSTEPIEPPPAAGPAGWEIRLGEQNARAVRNPDGTCIAVKGKKRWLVHPTSAAASSEGKGAPPPCDGVGSPLPPFEEEVTDLAAADGAFFYLTEQGALLRSTPRENVATPMAEQPFLIGAIAATGSSVLAAEKQGDGIARLSKGKWTKLQFPSGGIGRVVGRDDGAAALIVNPNRAFSSRDEGATWKQISSDADSLSELETTPSGALVARGHKQRADLSGDHGVQLELSPPSSSRSTGSFVAKVRPEHRPGATTPAGGDVDTDERIRATLWKQVDSTTIIRGTLGALEVSVSAPSLDEGCSVRVWADSGRTSREVFRDKMKATAVAVAKDAILVVRNCPKDPVDAACERDKRLVVLSQDGSEWAKSYVTTPDVDSFIDPMDDRRGKGRFYLLGVNFHEHKPELQLLHLSGRGTLDTHPLDLSFPLPENYPIDSDGGFFPDDANVDDAGSIRFLVESSGVVPLLGYVRTSDSGQRLESRSFPIGAARFLDASRLGVFGPHVVDLEPDGQIFTSADGGATFEHGSPPTEVAEAIKQFGAYRVRCGPTGCDFTSEPTTVSIRGW